MNQIGTEQLRIGTRSSRLACAQAELLKQYLESRHPHLRVSLVKMKTEGDRILDKKLDEIGGKGLFVKELDAALAQGRTDLSVHSLKDMPFEENADYPILGYSKREIPFDALVLRQGFARIDLNQPIGTSSPRRSVQLPNIYPGCQIKSVRGNILTRLEKLDRGEYGALVLAAAGLVRLGLENRISRLFPASEMIPAPGQGILAENAKLQALAERSFVRALGGGCASPAAAYAEVNGDEMILMGLVPCEGGAVKTVSRKGKKWEAVRLGAESANACKIS